MKRVETIDHYPYHPQGFVRSRSTRYNDDGKIVEVLSGGKNNLVVTTSRDSFATLLTDPNNHDYLIRYFAMGQGHHAVGDPNTPIPPVLSDTALEDEQFRKNYTSASYPDARSVEYYTKVGLTEANDHLWYSECALFSDTVMFSINVPSTGAWVKNDHLEIEFWWRIVF